MCYHIQIPPAEEIEEALGDEPWWKNSIFAADYRLNTEYEKRYHTNGFDHDAIPVMTGGEPLLIQKFHWGLIPPWVKNTEQARELQNMTLNATCENIFDKPSFRESAFKQRCAIIVKGFFENRHEGKKKYPYFIKLKEERIFFLGGLSSLWINPQNGERLRTCAIITTPANTLMRKIHNTKMRMPLIVPAAQLTAWLNPNATKEEVTAIMQPFDDGQMEAYTIGPLVNGGRNKNSNVPEVTKAAVYPELQMLDAMF